MNRATWPLSGAVLAAILAFGGFGLAARAQAPLLVPPAAAHLTVSAPALAKGVVPKANSCDGADVSPALSWQGAPAATKSFVILVTDPDAPLTSVRGPFVHWVLFNVPASTTMLPEHVAPAATLPDGARQGTNGFDKLGYNGACPPAGQTHRYYFDVYALDALLTNAPGASFEDVLHAMSGHVLAHGQVMARFEH